VVSTGGAGVSVTFFPFRFGGGGGDEEEDDSYNTSSGTATFLTYRHLGGAEGAAGCDYGRFCRLFCLSAARRRCLDGLDMPFRFLTFATKIL